MNTAWRMSFRCGDRGARMWPQCLRHRVAALTYKPICNTDFSRHKKMEPKELWAKLEPTQKASLKRIAYEMQAGDVIYVKEGPQIIGKGHVLGSYKYDDRNRIVDPFNTPWNQQVPVNWEKDFQPIGILLGAEQLTVKRLDQGAVKVLEQHIARKKEETHRLEVMEGEAIQAEVIFRKRNRAIIAAKKALSDGLCEVCGMSFKGKYGISSIGLVAHHINPIGQRKNASVTTIDDISLLCPNCHSVAHTKNPPMSNSQIKAMLQ